MIFIRPINDPKAPGWRLRLERADGEMAKLAEERTLLEKVNDPEANLVEPADCFWLTREDAVWLRDGLSSLLASWPEPSHQVKPCAYCQQQPVLGHTTEDGMRPTSWSLMCECGRGQHGPIKEVGVNGCQIDDMIKFSRMTVEAFNKQFPCRENSIAITKLQEAELWLMQRKLEREARGVEGLSQK